MKGILDKKSIGIHKKQPSVYVFFREGGWYPIELEDDNDAIENAKCNPGTVRVEDARGNIIWEDKNK